MIACLPLLWTYDDADPAAAGRVQQRCSCGWCTDTYENTEINRERLARRGRDHTADSTEEIT